MNKLGTALEKEVAQYFRERGAIKVAHDVEIMGNQIDAVATEQTPAGELALDDSKHACDALQQSDR
jgi:hypothetical protein